MTFPFITDPNVKEEKLVYSIRNPPEIFFLQESCLQVLYSLKSNEISTTIKNIENQKKPQRSTENK